MTVWLRPKFQISIELIGFIIEINELTKFIGIRNHNNNEIHIKFIKFEKFEKFEKFKDEVSL